MREGCEEVGGATGLFRSRGLVRHAQGLDFIRSTRGEEACDPGSRRGLCVCVCVCVCARVRAHTHKRAEAELDPQPHPGGSGIGIKGCGGRGGGPGTSHIGLPASPGPLKQQSVLPQGKHGSLMVFLCVLKLRCLPVLSLIGLELFMFLFYGCRA